MTSSTGGSTSLSMYEYFDARAIDNGTVVKILLYIRIIVGVMLKAQKARAHEQRAAPSYMKRESSLTR